MNKEPKQRDESEVLAQRLHCLTCLLTDAVDRADGGEIQALFVERSHTLDELAKVVITPKAGIWLDRTAELESETLAAWRRGQIEMSNDVLANERKKSNLQQYRRNQAA